MMKSPLTPLLLLAAVMLIGCDDRAAQIAADAAQSQAEQNRAMARVNQGVLKATEQLHEERAQLNVGRDELEAERRQIASSRRTESMLAALLRGSGAAVAALLSIALAWIILAAGNRQQDADAAVCELLVTDLASDAPMLVRPAGDPDADLPQRLPPPAALAVLTEEEPE